MSLAPDTAIAQFVSRSFIVALHCAQAPEKITVNHPRKYTLTRAINSLRVEHSVESSVTRD